MTMGNRLLGDASIQANAIPPPPAHQGGFQDLNLWRDLYQEAWASPGHSKYDWAAWRYLEQLGGAP